jgi:hypothetical protein
VVGAQRHGHQRERWDVVRQARGLGGEEARRPREAQPVDEQRPLKRSRRKWKWWWSGGGGGGSGEVAREETSLRLRSCEWW